MTSREELIQGTDAPGKFLSQVNRIKIPHGNSQELNAAGCVVGFKRFPSEIDGAHIVIRLQIEHGGDAGFEPELIDVAGVFRMRSKEELRKQLSVIHCLFPEPLETVRDTHKTKPQIR